MIKATLRDHDNKLINKIENLEQNYVGNWKGQNSIDVCRYII